MTSQALTCNGRRRHGRPGARAGFTLIEMLLVLVLVGIISAITVPNFVRSIRGNRLRAAVRSVVMAGRYARSMAVLKQSDLLLSIDLAGATFKVEEVLLVAATNTLEDAAAELGDGRPDYKVESRTTLLGRTLDGVSVRAVVIDGARRVDGAVSILYSSNGRCTPYAVELVDSEGRGVVIEVDALSATETERL